MNDYDEDEYEDEYRDGLDGYEDDNDYGYENAYDIHMNELAWEAYRKSWRGRLDQVIRSVKSRLDYTKRWLKWHNHKCTNCGQPALYDGEICDGCFIPF